MRAEAGATWGRLLADAVERLGSIGDARRLLEAASGLGGADLVIASDTPAPGCRAARLRAMIERRRRGEPLQYVIGTWGFRHLDLVVDRRVLIPRPETETVVDAVLGELARRRASSPEGRALRVADLGTGSGAIALSVASEAEATGAGPVQVWATDRSAAALEVAAVNLAGLDARTRERVHLAQGDWWAALPAELLGQLDLVVSNPPYVACGEEIEGGVRDWEPAEALWSGDSGLEATERILSGAPAWLGRPGTVILEIAADRSGPSRALADAAGFHSEVRSDLTGRDRVLIGRLPTASRVPCAPPHVQ